MYCYKMIPDQSFLTVHIMITSEIIHTYLRVHTHTHTHTHTHIHTESLSSIPCGMGWVINGVSVHCVLLTIYLHYLSLYINKNSSSQK